MYPVYAQVQTQEEAREKIDSSLLARLDEMEDADTIDVSVWVTDIDHEQTEENTQQALEAKVQRGETGRDVLTLAEAAQSVKENAKATRSASVDTDLQALDEISPEDAKNSIHGPHYPPDGSGDSPTPVYEVPKETLLLNVYDSRPMMIYESYYQKDTKEYIAFEPYTAGQYSFRVYKISNPYVTGVPVVIAWYQQ